MTVIRLCLAEGIVPSRNGTKGAEMKDDLDRWRVVIEHGLSESVEYTDTFMFGVQMAAHKIKVGLAEKAWIYAPFDKQEFWKGRRLVVRVTGAADLR